MVQFTRFMLAYLVLEICTADGDRRMVEFAPLPHKHTITFFLFAKGEANRIMGLFAIAISTIFCAKLFAVVIVVTAVSFIALSSQIRNTGSMGVFEVTTILKCAFSLLISSARFVSLKTIVLRLDFP